MIDLNGFTLSGAIEKALRDIVPAFHRDWLAVADKESTSAANGEAVAYKYDDPYHSPIWDPEKHEFLEICICIDGQFDLQVGDERLTLLKETVFLILPGIVHRELPGKGRYTAVWLSANMNRAAVHLSGRGENTPFSTVDIHVFKPSFDYLNLFNNITLELVRKEDYFLEAAKACVVKLLAVVYREIKGAANWSAHENWKETIAGEIINYIKSKVNSHIKLDEVAQSVCISPNYLNTIFKSVTGKTIIQYHEDHRLDRAKSMLGDCSNKIYNISMELGYCDQYHFSKAFKKAMGMTPSDYRKHAKESI